MASTASVLARSSTVSTCPCVANQGVGVDHRDGAPYGGRGLAMQAPATAASRRTCAPFTRTQRRAAASLGGVAAPAPPVRRGVAVGRPVGRGVQRHQRPRWASPTTWKTRSRTDHPRQAVRLPGPGFVHRADRPLEGGVRGLQQLGTHAAHSPPPAGEIEIVPDVRAPDHVDQGPKRQGLSEKLSRGRARRCSGRACRRSAEVLVGPVAEPLVEPLAAVPVHVGQPATASSLTRDSAPGRRRGPAPARAARGRSGADLPADRALVDVEPLGDRRGPASGRLGEVRRASGTTTAAGPGARPGPARR